VIETIENSQWRLSLSAKLGASPTALQAQIGGEWQDILRPTAPELLEGTSSAKFSSYTLAPWSNRIPNGIFTFQGQTHQLRVNIGKEQTARHGDVQDRAWKVINHGSSLECSFDSSWFPGINFPFPFSMTITHTLKNSMYITVMTLTNTGSSPMPAGMGIHPYFVRRNSTPELWFQANNIYLTDSSNVPTKAAEPIPERFDFNTQKPLSDLEVDHVYQGWDGELRLVWEDITLYLEGTEVFEHLVVFTGAPDQTIALEPITHATNAFNLAAQGIENTGHRVLGPQETITGEIWMWIEPTEIEP
jgi:aldose 1-epimerase